MSLVPTREDEAFSRGIKRGMQLGNIEKKELMTPKPKEIKPENWAIILDKYGLRPLSTRILVQEDEFSSKYDCKTCGGLGHTNEKCGNCKGSKFELINGELNNCRACTVGQDALKKTYGYKLCPTCSGKGGTIIIADDQKKRPTTGTVIAIGTGVTEFAVGAKVLYSNYTGNNFSMFGLELRTMHETDVYCEIKNYDANVKSFPIEEKVVTEDKEVGV